MTAESAFSQAWLDCQKNHVLPHINDREEFICYTASHHQEVFEMFWFLFGTIPRCPPLYTVSGLKCVRWTGLTGHISCEYMLSANSSSLGSKSVRLVKKIRNTVLFLTQCFQGYIFSTTLASLSLLSPSIIPFSVHTICSFSWTTTTIWYMKISISSRTTSLYPMSPSVCHSGVRESSFSSTTDVHVALYRNNSYCM